ncbi:nicotinamide mononucleotide transporter [Amnibacterium kyonggiense]|uniref:nicotinamide mononucleotide transporter n=1 Tax=Amnibacterium kyonggiense TaxID=595671 RepID=UPI0013C2F42C|nr:nicotinamide mononucleotide transporter [Amnibacterium kyonggiense]
MVSPGPEIVEGFASRTSVRAIVLLVAAAVLGTVVLTWVLTSFTDPTTQLADASTISMSLVGQYMLDRPWIEN